VDDKIEYVEGAKKAGLDAVLFEGFKKLPDGLKCAGLLLAQ
jgi:hypothetical protein